MVHWNKDGFRTAVCSIPPLHQSVSGLRLMNHCGIRRRLEDVRRQFRRLYSVRWHGHHYCPEYIEEDFFHDTDECVREVIDDYAFLNNRSDDMMMMTDGGGDDGEDDGYNNNNSNKHSGASGGKGRQPTCLRDLLSL